MAARLTLNHRALEKILKEAVVKHLEDIAEDVVYATGLPEEDLEVETWVGVNRARVSVKTANPAAHIRESRDHDLVRALSAVQRG